MDTAKDSQESVISGIKLEETDNSIDPLLFNSDDKPGDMIGVVVKEEHDETLKIKDEPKTDDEFEVGDLRGEIIAELMENQDYSEDNVLKGEIIEELSDKPVKFDNMGFNSSQKPGILKKCYFSYYFRLGLMGWSLKPSMFLCEICGYQQSATHKFYKHYITHMDLSELDEVFECDKCNYKTRFKYSLKSHIDTVHMKRKKFKCNDCDFCGSTINVLRRHQILHSSYRYINTKKDFYKCHICDYKHKKKYFLDQHLRKHMDLSDSDMFKCNLCSYKSKRKNNLDIHMLSHKDISETKSYDCELCEYRTKYAHLLRGHIKTNHKNFPKSLIRKCDQCNFETNNKYSLDTHIKSNHPKEKENKVFKCDQCDYQGKTSNRLKVHQYSRHKDYLERQRFECYNCGSKYLSKKYLKNHIITKHLLKL